MTLTPHFSTEFRADLERAALHRKCDLESLQDVIRRLTAGAALDRRHRDHALKGRFPPRRGGYTDCRECHAGNDWLLVYRVPGDGTIRFLRTGTHSDLF